MLEVYSKALYRGIEVPEDLTDQEMADALDILIPGRWAVEFPEGSALAEKDPQPRLVIELPWGHVPAFRGDFIVVDEYDTVGVLPRMHFRSQRLKRHAVSDLTGPK